MPSSFTGFPTTLLNWYLGVSQPWFGRVGEFSIVPRGRVKTIKVTIQLTILTWPRAIECHRNWGRDVWPKHPALASCKGTIVKGNVPSARRILLSKLGWLTCPSVWKIDCRALHSVRLNRFRCCTSSRVYEPKVSNFCRRTGMSEHPSPLSL